MSDVENCSVPVGCLCPKCVAYRNDRERIIEAATVEKIAAAADARARLDSIDLYFRGFMFCILGMIFGSTHFESEALETISLTLALAMLVAGLLCVVVARRRERLP